MTDLPPPGEPLDIHGKYTAFRSFTFLKLLVYRSCLKSLILLTFVACFFLSIKQFQIGVEHTKTKRNHLLKNTTSTKIHSFNSISGLRISQPRISVLKKRTRFHFQLARMLFKTGKYIYKKFGFQQQ